MTKHTHKLSCLAAAAAILGGAAAQADVLLSLNFETGDTASGWYANGNTMMFDNFGNPGRYMGIPYSDFWGVTLSARDPESLVLGDVTALGPIRISVDVSVFRADTFFGDPLDMTQWPMIFEFVDFGDGSPGSYATVYTEVGHWPITGMGWSNYVFELPAAQDTLPAGWFGSGEEDPVTFEPRLPAGRTFRNVLQSVDEVRITTFKPGYFYAANFWEAGFDNLIIETVVPCGNADFDGDGDAGTDADIEAFFACLGGTCCATCGSADFDNDGDSGTDADIEAFFAVLGGGGC